MATLMTQYVMGQMGGLRFQPTAKRIRILADGETVADTTRAVLVWEPRRVTPQYAVPAADLQADLADAPRDDDAREVRVVIRLAALPWSIRDRPSVSTPSMVSRLPSAPAAGTALVPAIG
jgi:hypothetical protein